MELIPENTQLFNQRELKDTPARDYIIIEFAEHALIAVSSYPFTLEGYIL